MDKLSGDSHSTVEDDQSEAGENIVTCRKSACH